MPKLAPSEALTNSNPVPEHPSPQQLLQPLIVHFRRFVCQEIKTAEEAHAQYEPSQSTPWNRLSNTPDFLLESGQVNPVWVEIVRPIHRRVIYTPEGKHDTPGKLIFTKTKAWQAVDPNSPIGRIARLQQQAREAQATNAANIKTVEKAIRKELVDIFNDYAGKRFNGIREVVNALDFRGVTLDNIAYRSLRIWRDRLVRTRYQAIIPELSDRWEYAPKSLRTPNRADQFLMALYKEISHPSGPSSNAHLLAELISIPDAKGYRAIANAFYGGDMHKTYDNISTIAKMTEQKLPEGWQAFHGSTTEFRALQKRISTFTGGVDGYLSAADELYGGDMFKTYLNLATIAKMTEQKLPEGWQAFHGSTTEFRILQTKIETVTGGLQGYLSAADELYGGAMLKTYVNLSAVAKVTKQKLPGGWQGFQGSTTEFRALQSKITTLAGGAEGYLSAAEEFYRGDMFKTHVNLSAIANMTGQSLPGDWQQFQGSTTEFKKQQQWLMNNPRAPLDMFMVYFGTTNRKKARLNLAAIRNMTM